MSSIKISATMPEMPGKLPPIFTLRTPKVDEKALLDLARSFKLKARVDAGSVIHDKTGFTYSEGPFILKLHSASGAFRLKDRDRWQIDHKANVKLSDEAAVKLAMACLARYKLLPEESRVLRVSRLNVAAAGPDRRMVDHRVIDVAVHLQPIVRGLPVDGPGGTVTVYLDHKGKMTCIDHISRPVGRVYRKVTRLRKPEEAVDEARKVWVERGVRRAEVREVRLCYYEMGWNEEQRYLQPAYIILATLFGGNERFRTEDVYVTPAAVNRVGGIVSVPPKRRAVQKLRKGR